MEEQTVPSWMRGIPVTPVTVPGAAAIASASAGASASVSVSSLHPRCGTQSRNQYPGGCLSGRNALSKTHKLFQSPPRAAEIPLRAEIAPCRNPPLIFCEHGLHAQPVRRSHHPKV
eukprot:1188702-Prorocentrum_minimum.AAC.3